MSRLAKRDTSLQFSLEMPSSWSGQLRRRSATVEQASGTSDAELTFKHLPIGAAGDEVYAVLQGGALKGLASDSDFARARRESWAAAMDRTQEMMQRAAKETEGVARGIFGERAYVKPEMRTDRETGRSEAVLEVHYCFPNDLSRLDELAELHERFMARYTQEVSADLRRFVVMTSVATDD